MISIIENVTKWTAVATISALLIAVSHEYGYFSIVGAHFQTVATTLDYLVNALVWLPSTFFMVGIIVGFKDWITEPAPYQRPRLPKVLFRVTLSLAVFFGTVTFFIGGNFEYEIAYTAAIIIIYLGLWAYAFHYSHLAWENYRILLFVPLIFIFSFYYGRRLAYDDLKKTSDVYVLKYKKTYVVRPVVLLRGFERGLLVKDQANESIELIRWDELQSFSRMIPSKKEPPLACSWLDIGCKPARTP